MITLQVRRNSLFAVAAGPAAAAAHPCFSIVVPKDPKDPDKHNYTKFYHMLQQDEDDANAAAAAKPKVTSEVKGAARQTSAIMVRRQSGCCCAGFPPCAAGWDCPHRVPPFHHQNQLKTTEGEWKKDLGLHSSWDSAVRTGSSSAPGGGQPRGCWPGHVSPARCHLSSSRRPRQTPKILHTPHTTPLVG